VSVSTEVPAPRGFRAFRIEENEPTRVVKYRVEIDRTITVAVSEKADMDPVYVEQTLRYAVSQLAFEVRDIIEEIV
jgi:hypothetical protein